MVGTHFFIAVGVDYSNTEFYDNLPALRNALARVKKAFSQSMCDCMPDVAGDVSPNLFMAKLEETVSKTLGSEDHLLIYLGGHGHKRGDDFFIAGPTADNRISNRNSFSANEIAGILSQGNPKHIALVFDACYSFAGASSLTSTIDQIFDHRRRPDKQISIITSAGPLDEIADGLLLEGLLDVLAASEPAVWGKKTFAPSQQVAELLRDRLGPLVSFRTLGLDGEIFPVLANYQPSLEQLKRRGFIHFLTACAGTEKPDGDWHFVGRKSQLAKIQHWLKQNTTGVHVVTGAPGAGKSAMMGFLAFTIISDWREEAARKYLGLDKLEEIDAPKDIVGVVLHAREKTLEGVLREVCSWLDLEVDSGRDELLASISEKRKKLIFIVDSLDESVDVDAVPLAEFLRELADIPDCIVFVGTRPDHARRTYTGSRAGPLLSALDPEAITNLSHDEDEAHSDIYSYVCARFRKSANLHELSICDQTVHEAAEIIATRVSGVFLYARLIVQALSRDIQALNSGEWVDRYLGVGEGSVLESVVSEDMAKVPSDIRERVRHMLMALAWAEGEGLPRYRVWSAIASAISGLNLDDSDAATAIRYAPWYLTESREFDAPVYRLHHEELVRYFRGVSRNE